MKDLLIDKIRSHKARVAVIGMGYVGLPLIQEFVKKGYHTYGIDIDPEKVRFLQEGRSYITDIKDFEIQEIMQTGRFFPGTSYEVLEEADAIIITVPTPLSKTRDPDISYVMAATESILQHLHRGQLIVLESTTYPGTTEELVKPKLEESGLRSGVDFFLAYSPERINPGDPVYRLPNTPKVVGGVDPESTEVAVTLYQSIIQEVVPVSSAKVAEMVKLLENTFRSVNIALVNEMAIACSILGIDIWEVIEAAGTKPFGFMKFYPGPGIGGHCIPVDPHYLAWKLKTLNYNARFIELASEINTSMPRHIVTRVQDALNNIGRPIKGSKILILGVAYKRDINDIRESPALDIMEMLREKGAILFYHDPYVPSFVVGGERFESTELNDEFLKSLDIAVIVTDHSNVPYDRIVRTGVLVFDTRNVLKGVQAPNILRL